MMEIIKEDGTREPFDREKLSRSLRAASAPDALLLDILRHVEGDLKEGMRTDDIYAHAFNMLREKYRPAAARYSLKRAIMELGPSGFPFERFIARILEAEGYQTAVDQIVKGKCVFHEVDIVAQKGGERILTEAKFHNQNGAKTDVKVALYVDARFRDVAAGREANGESDVFHRAWLITNTSFTSNAIAYGKCSGLLMTGWNYPKGYTLEDLVSRARVHPLTCLTTLSQGEKRQLLDKGTVLCKDVLGKTDLLKSIGIAGKKADDVLEEGTLLCTA